MSFAVAKPHQRGSLSTIGSLDATPLFLVLLSEVWRWTGDPVVVQELIDAARSALRWIEEFGDRDGDGFIEYERRAEHGLANQSWKDSGDSQRFRDGSLAGTPIAPAECQGYVFDALLRTAELAQHVWDDPDLAELLVAKARALQRRFDDAFWLEERQVYAMALDGDKRRVDSLASNIGHLLWSGIVPARRRDQIAAALAGDALWSGWGVRTMGSNEAAYNPLSYHNGTVWPHDTALAINGLARSGYVDQSHAFGAALIEAAAQMDYSLPEVFAGYPRARRCSGRIPDLGPTPGLGCRRADSVSDVRARPPAAPDRRTSRQAELRTGPRRGWKERVSRVFVRSAESGRSRLVMGQSRYTLIDARRALQPRLVPRTA